VTQPTLRLDSPDGAWISFDPGTETAKLQSAAAVTLGVANIWTLSVWAYVRAATAGTFFATLPATGFQNRILLQIDSAHGSLYPEGEIAVTLSDNTAGTPLVLRRRRYSTPWCLPCHGRYQARMRAMSAAMSSLRSNVGPTPTTLSG